MTSPPQSSGSGAPRRSPGPADRQQDAERSRSALLAAALDEFSAKGFAGARVRDIATRAGVSKDLINYYFGSKEGLYRATLKEWIARGLVPSDATDDLGGVMVKHLRSLLEDPRTMRLLVWHGLTEGDPFAGAGEPRSPQEEPLPDLRELLARRQETGEFPADLDPASLALVLIGAMAAPIVLPLVVERAFGVTVDDPEFADRYARGLQDIVGRLSSGLGQGYVGAS